MIGRVSAPEGSTASASDSAAAKKSGLRDSRSGAAGEERATRGREASRSKSSAGEQDLAQILAGTSRLERTQKLLAFLDRLPTDQFASVYEEMKNSPLSKLQGSERSLVLQAFVPRAMTGWERLMLAIEQNCSSHSMAYEGRRGARDFAV